MPHPGLSPLHKDCRGEAKKGLDAEMIQPKQITVFGASGFVGRNVVRRLASSGARIIAASRDSEKANFLRTMGDVGQVVPVPCNVTDRARVAALLEGSDAVVNLVGILFEAGRQRFSQVQGDAPGLIAEAAREVGVSRLVQVSAISADAGSASHYARSKAAGEAGARAVLPQTVILRPSIVFGPGDGFFARFAAMARYSPVLPLFGGGRNRFQPVYVGDVAEAVFTALTDADLAGRTFELGGPRIYTFRELMELITEATGRRRLLLPLPLALADFIGLFGDMVARFGITPALTRDQAELLRLDNVVGPSAEGFGELGIDPTPVEAVIRSFLSLYRRAGGPQDEG